MNDEINQTDDFPEDAQEKPKRRRTIWMWLILVFSVLSFIAFVPVQIFSDSGLARFLWISIYSIFLAASLSLFFFRAIAYKLFLISLLVEIITTFYTEEVLSFPAESLTGLILRLFLYIAVILYSLRLKRYGWLVE